MPTLVSFPTTTTTSPSHSPPAQLYTEHLATLQDGTEAEAKAVALASRAAAFSKLGMEQEAFEVG